MKLTDPRPLRRVSLLVRESAAAYLAITRTVGLFVDLASRPYANFPAFDGLAAL